MLSAMAKLLKLLNSEASPAQISWAFAFAMFVGFTPFLGLHNLIVVFLVCITRVNFSAFFLATAFFSLLAYGVDALSVSVGQSLLESANLESLWTSMYQNDMWRAFMFNHTLLLGSVVVSLALFIPVLVLSQFLIVNYRERFMRWFETLRITQLVKASKFFTVYETLGA